MSFLIIIAMFAMSAWGVFTTFQRLRRANASQAWWFIFGSLVVIGLSAGCWLAFRFEYQISPQMRYMGFPMPLTFFHLENGQWIDFVTPPYVRYFGLVANVIAIVAVALLPLLLASLVSGRKHNA